MTAAEVDREHPAGQERDRPLDELRTLEAEMEQRVEARTAELQKALRERDVLLREVLHRVKNDLQVISSLISLQLRSLPAGASREALEECRARVHAIALIHDQLHPSRDHGRVPFSEYARRLAAQVFQATAMAPESVTLQLAVEDVALEVDEAMSCGLILNELLTNALQHAFPDGRRGTVRVELARLAGGGLRLVVGDDGVGLPAGLDVSSSPSLGLQLVRMLANQLGAELEVAATGGTTIRLTVRGEG